MSAPSSPSALPPEVFYGGDGYARELRTSAEKHAQTAVILERLTNRLDEHDRRIKALESAPGAQARARDVREGLTIQTAVFIVMALTLLWSGIGAHVTVLFH